MSCALNLISAFLFASMVFDRVMIKNKTFKLDRVMIKNKTFKLKPTTHSDRDTRVSSEADPGFGIRGA